MAAETSNTNALQFVAAAMVGLIILWGTIFYEITTAPFFIGWTDFDRVGIGSCAVMVAAFVVLGVIQIGLRLFYPHTMPGKR